MGRSPLPPPPPGWSTLPWVAPHCSQAPAASLCSPPPSPHGSRRPTDPPLSSCFRSSICCFLRLRAPSRCLRGSGSSNLRSTSHLRRPSLHHLLPAGLPNWPLRGRGCTVSPSSAKPLHSILLHLRVRGHQRPTSACSIRPLHGLSCSFHVSFWCHGAPRRRHPHSRASARTSPTQWLNG